MYVIFGSIHSDANEAEREERQIVGRGRWWRCVEVTALGPIAAVLATILAASGPTGDHDPATSAQAGPRNVTVPAGRQERVVPAVERDAAQTTTTAAATTTASAAVRHRICGGASSSCVDDFRGLHNSYFEPNDGHKNETHTFIIIYYVILWFSVVGIFRSLKKTIMIINYCWDIILNPFEFNNYLILLLFGAVLRIFKAHRNPSWYWANSCSCPQYYNTLYFTLGLYCNFTNSCQCFWYSILTMATTYYFLHTYILMYKK